MQTEEKQRNSKVHVVRIPLDISNEILERAELRDHSFNHVVVRLLQKQLEQEKQKESKAI
jgi:predicted HicB family RNase H-like nuclease